MRCKKAFTMSHEPLLLTFLNFLYTKMYNNYNNKEGSSFEKTFISSGSRFCSFGMFS